jgi:hypothetical protein
LRAGDRTRTGDVQLGKLAFYQLNYAREASATRAPCSTAPTVGISRGSDAGGRPIVTRAPAHKKTSGEPEVEPREHLESHWSDLNRRPLDYESSALPLSYSGDFLTMPWRGFEPRRLAAPPPQDGVSTSFTTRAMNCGECVGSYVGNRSINQPAIQLTNSPLQRGRRGSNPRPLE